MKPHYLVICSVSQDQDLRVCEWHLSLLGPESCRTAFGSMLATTRRLNERKV